MLRALTQIRLGLIVFLFFCGQACAQHAEWRDQSSLPLLIETGNGVHEFIVELADEPAETAKGLMLRESLADNAGMLFDFGAPRPLGMWMKNTLIPLDMAFIGADGVIINIARQTTPHSLKPIYSDGPALAVLEVNGGALAEIGVMPGDRVRHPLFDKAAPEPDAP